jgi:hypothetical protein
MKSMKISAAAVLPVLATMAALLSACDKAPKYDTNLLKNSSFEEVGGDGIPKNWELALFKGSPDQPEVRWGVDTLAVDGKRSFYFAADPGTRRFHFLQQEVKVVGASQIRIKGWMLADGVKMKADQSAMCNFLLTYYNKDHQRFQMERQADRRTPLRSGSYPWEEQVYTFDVPDGTHYIAVACLLGMNGQVWFDHVSLEIPKPVPWETQTTKNYVFHWLPGKPMPAGAPEEQQARFEHCVSQLGVNSDVVINYYFYPDTLTIQNMIGIKGVMYTNWDDYEFHTTMAGDDHEVVHFITDSVGRPPRVIAEGTVIWLQDRWGNQTLDEQISSIVRRNMVAKFTDLFEYDNLARADPESVMATAAALVKYLVETGGREKLMELYRSIHGMNTYLPISKGFEAVYEKPLQQTEQEFHQWLIKKYK